MRAKTGGTLRGAAIACLAIFMLTGCSQMDTLVSQVEDTWTPDRTTVEVMRDGSLRETLLETLERDYYDPAELEKLVDSAVSEYNTAAGSQKVLKEEMTVEERNVRLVLTYPSAADYEAFNLIPFFAGSMLNAQMEGYLFSHAFRKVNKDGVVSEETISGEEPLSHKEYQVVVSDLSHAVHVPGRILYISENAELMDSHTAAPAGGGEEEKQEGLVLPSSAVYVEEDEKDAAPVDPEEYYMYVIYEF